jgi:8-oxo-dGTP pyrophosphatase MutT (NUDIX family)
MLHLIPAPLHRLALRIAYRLRARWWALTKNSGRAVSLVGLDGEGRVLLVRHSYGSGRWTLPGGGLGAREDAVDGLRREIREELACELTEIALAFETLDVVSGGEQRGHIFIARIAGEPCADGREILECGWFDPADLPPDTMDITRRRIARALG